MLESKVSDFIFELEKKELIGFVFVGLDSSIKTNRNKSLLIDYIQHCFADNFKLFEYSTFNRDTKRAARAISGK